ncbi:hypothetical protein N8I77_010664 [Diaporthe amygdali]|uniref:Uncharacterized protein n=1 Tax=Phomopsis amygdali TaxID=1214568 RepID=A0AAD9VZM1_PHOAM|nr:hypothetical protein N8I77_010664 [Diaporthe amygdali]
MDARSPATPNTPYGQASQYKVNVNRQKTRKWVEAKAQNYDGDDWGAEDDLDEYDAHDTGSAGGRQDYFNQPPQPQRPGRLTAGLRAISNSGPPTPGSGSAGSSPSLRPSERIALEKQAAGNRSASGPPALHIQTPITTQTQPPPQVVGPPGGPADVAASPFPPRKSSMTRQDRPNLTNPDARPPRTSSRPESPANATRSPASATGPPKFIRPSDIYKRMEEEKEKERRSLESVGRPSLDSLGGRSGDESDSTNARRRPSFGRNDEGDANRSLRPLDTVAERKSEYGFDGLMINPAESAPPKPEVPTQFEPRNASVPEPKSQPEPSISSQPQPPTLHHPQATLDPGTTAEPVKRYSTSPKLPLLSRMSGFGGDFFSGGLGFTADSPKSSEPPTDSTPTRTDASGGDDITHAPRTVNDGHSSAPQSSEPRQAKPSRPSFPGAWVSETATTPGEMATPGSNIAATSGDVPSISESPEDAHLKPAPLRTPSPGSASAFSAHNEQQLTRSGSTSPANHQYLEATAERPIPQGGPTRDFTLDQDSQDKARARRDMTPIAPLQPRKGSFVEESSEQPRDHITRVDTVSTADNASPLKESDVLRDEIMRSLSPVRPSDGHMEAPRDESALRESAYLNDVYGDYWSGEDKPPEVPLKQQDSREPEPTPAAKDEEADATPKPPAHPAFEPVKTDTAPPAIPAAEPEPSMPALRRERFSWEAASNSGGNSAQPSPTKQATTESPETLTSPVTAARQEDPSSPHGDGRTSPLLSLPTLNFADSDISPQVVSAVSTHPPGQGLTASDTQSPQSNTSGQDVLSPEADEGANRNLYPTEDKMLVQSPMSPLSPMEPIPIPMPDDEEAQRATSPPPAAEPEGVPLPRSPSPTQAGGAGEKRQSQIAYNNMSLKQILQLPSPADRVQKMQETRDHFAALEAGLAAWLADMAAQPAHENAMASYGYALSGEDAELWGTKGGAARIPLNAPAETGEEGAGGGGAAGAPHVGRTASTSINMGNLVHHSGQAGAKGKELLQSAGKMGKGLLSKGKNKLRERAESKRA